MYFPDPTWRTALSPLPGFILLLISHHFQIVNSAERFKVIGPDHPVVAVLGGDAVLPCRLSPALSAEHMKVRWFRIGFDFIVHLYENEMDQNRKQLSQYSGRTEFIRNNISSGSVSLRIHNIRLDDEGSYTCFFQSDTYYEDATLELKVASLGSSPSISVTDHQDGGIRVLCESAGWYPEPEVTWSQEDGQNVTSVSETETQEHNGLFNVKTSLLMRTNQHGKISCHIRNTVINQERESAISIADPFVQRVSLHPGVCDNPMWFAACVGNLPLKERKRGKRASSAQASTPSERFRAASARFRASSARFRASSARFRASSARFRASSGLDSDDSLDLASDDAFDQASDDALDRARTPSERFRITSQRARIASERARIASERYRAASARYRAASARYRASLG